MITKDRLWKAIFEEFFPEAIRFYFPQYYHQIDWSKDFDVLDKELRELFPDSATNERRVDLLVKVWMLDGTEKWMLVHVEVQGSKDQGFPKRMYTYNYRITDRYGVPVAALAVLTDNNKSWRPGPYVTECLGTRLVYEYPIFKLSDYKEKDLMDNPNPWAIIMRAALGGLKANWTDEALLKMKVNIYRDLRERGFNPDSARYLFEFVKYYVRFQEREFFHTFDNETNKIDNIKKQPMGMKELLEVGLIEEAKEEGREEGREEGMEEGKLKNAITAIRNLLKRKFPTEEIADVLVVSQSFVNEMEGQLKKEQLIFKELRTGKLHPDKIAEKLNVHPLLVQVIDEARK